MKPSAHHKVEILLRVTDGSTGSGQEYSQSLEAIPALSYEDTVLFRKLANVVLIHWWKRSKSPSQTLVEFRELIEPPPFEL